MSNRSRIEGSSYNGTGRSVLGIGQSPRNRRSYADKGLASDQSRNGHGDPEFTINKKLEFHGGQRIHAHSAERGFFGEMISRTPQNLGEQNAQVIRHQPCSFARWMP